MSYAKKTCNLCGFRDIQPNMVRAKKNVKAYTSKDQIGVGTWIGWMAGEKSSIKRINKSLFANNKRKHTAHREVWMCPECAGVKVKRVKKVVERPVYVEPVYVEQEEEEVYVAPVAKPKAKAKPVAKPKKQPTGPSEEEIRGNVIIAKRKKTFGICFSLLVIAVLLLPMLMQAG